MYIYIEKEGRERRVVSSDSRLRNKVLVKLLVTISQGT